jgi:hypothetical protein
MTMSDDPIANAARAPALSGRRRFAVCGHKDRYNRYQAVIPTVSFFTGLQRPIGYFLSTMTVRPKKATGDLLVRDKLTIMNNVSGLTGQSA